MRLPGAFGTAVLFFVAGRINLFRNEHTKRSLVEQVQFVTCPADPPEGVRMGSGPNVFVTPMAVFRMDRSRGRFQLESAHPGVTREELIDNTGWALDLPDEVPVTPSPTAEELAALRGPVADDLESTYPGFFATNVLR